MIKISKAKLNNFAKFENFECTFDGQITRLVGLNGSGKSTVGLKGLIACLNGISEKQSGGALIGERFRFIGKNGKSADVEYEFIDESTGSKFSIKNHITESTNKITFKSESGEQINDDWLKGFLNVALMSAKNFCSLSGREQSIALGIDTSTFDNEIKSLKAEFTLLNRDLKNMGTIEPVEETAMISIDNLRAEKELVRKRLNEQYLLNKKHNVDLRTKHNEEVKRYEEGVNAFNVAQMEARDTIARANTSLEELTVLGYSGKEVGEWINRLPIPQAYREIIEIPEPEYIEELPSDDEITKIDAAIASAQEHNQKAQEYKNYLAKVAAKAAKQKEIDDNKAKQTESETARNAYISSFDFGFAGLTTDEQGGLLLKNRPLTESYFSKGELEIIVAKLHASINPVFKTRFIDDFDLLDEDNQEKLLTELIEAGFPVITAEVGKSSNKENCLVLSECKIKTEEEGKPELL